MRVADGPDIRTFTVDQKVHRQLARGASFIQCPSLNVRDGDQIFRHPAFARHRRRSEDAPIIKPDAHISIGRDDVTALVHQMTDFD
jgi:uncharacterized protein YktB (UPF0637 family)